MARGARAARDVVGAHRHARRAASRFRLLHGHCVLRMNASAERAPVSLTLTMPTVTVIVPCRNEAAFVGMCLDSIEANDFPHDRLEVLVVDGMSDDGTRDMVAQYTRRDTRIHLLDNPRRITPAALNIGIAAAKGDIIMRMDAHNAYPSNYISTLVTWLVDTGADNVGGAWITRPANTTRRARAIAAALAHPFGVGNAHFRLGVREPRWVDTVPFGCYRRDV